MTDEKTTETTSRNSTPEANKMDLNTLAQELRELRQRVDDGALLPAPPADAMPEVRILKDPARVNSKRDPTTFPTYSGDKTTYPAWRRAVISALKMDWNTFEYTDS
ncbi:hypothetical protein K3495_g17081, partial [Podosphaera aphanis]